MENEGRNHPLHYLSKYSDSNEADDTNTTQPISAPSLPIITINYSTENTVYNSNNNDNSINIDTKHDTSPRNENPNTTSQTSIGVLSMTDTENTSQPNPEPLTETNIITLTPPIVNIEDEPQSCNTNNNNNNSNTISNNNNSNNNNNNKKQEIKLPQCRTLSSRYEIINQIGEGTFGVVFRAKDITTKELVALKRIRMEAEKEGFPVTSFREIQLLKLLKHPNIVDLREVVVQPPSRIFLVFEYIEHDLARLIDTKRSPFSESHVKQLMLQLLKAVEFMHNNWVIHRDLKLANLLYSNKGELKVADFGLARLYGEPLKPLTPKVVTLWYRPPELLFGAKTYSTALDMWSVGCIMGELLLLKPLLPGRSELDQINQICNLLGSPNKNIWADFPSLPMAKDISLPHQPYNNLAQKIQGLTSNGYDLLNRFLSYDPNKRITASEAISHPYFRENPLPASKEMLPTFRTDHDLPMKKDVPPKRVKDNRDQQQFDIRFNNFKKQKIE